jgi:hypothetical protein
MFVWLFLFTNNVLGIAPGSVNCDRQCEIMDNKHINV